jgi:hypothetical protein
VTAFRKAFHFTSTIGVNIRTNAPSQQEGKPMHDDFASLFAFNRWANAKMFDACRKLTPEQYVAEPVPGWSSVCATVYHITLVTELWLRGLEGDPETPSRPRTKSPPSRTPSGCSIARTNGSVGCCPR